MSSRPRGTPIRRPPSWPSWRGRRHAPRLAGVRAVLVAPDGALNRLPFGPCPTRNPARCLLKRYAVGDCRADKWSSWPEPAKRPSADGGLLAVGGVDYGHGERATSDALTGVASIRRPIPPVAATLDLPPLPETKAEADDLAALFRHQQRGARHK